MDPVTVEPDALTALLRAVEVKADQRGWDKPPCLYVLYDNSSPNTGRYYTSLFGRFGAPIRCGTYIAQPQVPPRSLQPNASHAVFTMAHNLRTRPVLAMRYIAALRRPGFLGMALLCEGWARTEAQDRPDGVPFADLVGSREMRMVGGACVDGKSYGLVHLRGDESGWTDDGIDGAGAESLATMVAIVAGTPLPEVTAVPVRWGETSDRGR